MILRLFLISVVVKIFFYYPGRINAQFENTSVEQSQLVLLKCPNNFTVCQCLEDVGQIECTLFFAYVADEEKQVVTDLMQIKKAAPGLQEVQLFNFENSHMNKFELGALNGFFIREIKIRSNYDLKKIVGGVDQISVFLNVTTASIIENPKLGDDGLGDTLKAFSASQNLIKLDLSQNSLTGNDEGSEFLPGLSFLFYLEDLDLSWNKITWISTRHFEHLSRLKSLNLMFNKIVSIKGSLFFVKNNINDLEILLSYNAINIIYASAVESGSTNNFTCNKKSVSIKLGSNKLSNLPVEMFYDFLQSNENNTVDLWGNPLVCGKRIEWLKKSNNSRFSTQIQGARCSNLQGAPLFKDTEGELLNRKLLCPEPLQIAPCTCELEPLLAIRCIGDEIVQESIDNVVQVLRQVKELSQNELLDIYSFYIQKTELLELDLAVLFQMKIDSLVIHLNNFLTKITSTQMIPGSIHVEKLHIMINPKLDDDGLGDTLKLFSPTMQLLHISLNFLRGHFKLESNSSTRIDLLEREFFPGLGQLHDLKQLKIGGNKIEHLGVGRFRNNSKLELFDIGANQIWNLQKNVFIFRTNFEKTSESEIINIDLRWNHLNDESFPGNGFGSTPVMLALRNNKILSEEYFFPHIDDELIWSEETWRAISYGLIYKANGTFSSWSLTCPDAQEIKPCSCIENYGEVTCIGEEVTQKSVEILFQKLKNGNDIHLESTLIIEKLKIASTSLIQLDLSPLNNCNISTLFIVGNSNLSEITRNNFTDSDTVVVKELIVEFNKKLADSGIENLLTYFESGLEILSLAENSVTLNKTLNGLPIFKELKTINLRANKILRLLPNFFSGVINHLEHLDLSDNRIARIDQDAFGFFSKEDIDKNSNRLVINLNFNCITENSFPLNTTGVEKLQRPVQLNLVHNKMTTLPFAPFHSLFKKVSEKFQIDLYGNPLDCDWRLNWLEKTSVFNSSSTVLIENAECVNRPRKYIHNFQKSETQEFCSVMKNVWPCSCDSSSNSLECVGDDTTDEGVDELFLKIKRVDPFCSGIFPGLDQFVIRSTKLIQLDLSNFFQVCLTNLTSLVVDSNSYLSGIVGPPLTDVSANQSITVQNLQITSNPLNDEGLGSTLQYFSSEMEILNLNDNQLKGTLSFEFWSGLSNLDNLERIELNSNQIVHLPGGLFKESSKLRRISFVKNKISEISQNFFDFPTGTDTNETLVIDLSFNSLTDDSFDKKLFVDERSRSINLILSQNQFSTIPVVPFQSFLEANPTNQLNFEENLLRCDAKMDWIKNHKDKFNRSRIVNAQCDGDSIFNSNYFNSLDDGTLTIVLSIVIPAILMLVIVALFFWRKFRKARDHITYLSTKDIDEFRKGNSDLNPEVVHAAVMSQPFNKGLEISRDLLEFDEKKVLGSGQFGIVFKGIYKSTTGHVTVAIKTTVANSADLETFKSLLCEIKILDFLGSHQNVVQLVGASTTNLRKRDVLAVLEFCQNGDLRSFILGRKTNFQDVFAVPSINTTTVKPATNVKNPYENILTTVQLLKFAMGIANGLKFLKAKNVIHGDLAARNVLLTGKLETKISDFGLSRQLANYQNYLKTTKCPLPFKWMSIEAIKDMNFSICSDIWSFGVVLHEIFSLGESPYPGLVVDQNFLPRLIRGYRMDKPKYADQQIYELMLDTWKLAPLDRPSSAEIYGRLYQILDQITNGTESTSCVYDDL